MARDKLDYQRNYQYQKSRREGRKIRGPHWSGLSQKELGTKEYSRQIYQLQKQRKKHDHNT